MGMIDGSGPDKALVITADPVLACKITHRHRAYRDWETDRKSVV